MLAVFQAAPAVVPLLDGFPGGRCGLGGWGDLLGGHPFWDALSGFHLHPLIRVEDDQGHGFLNVPPLLRLRRRSDH